jgi:hypothetical protein
LSQGHCLACADTESLLSVHSTAHAHVPTNLQILLDSTLSANTYRLLTSIFPTTPAAAHKRQMLLVLPAAAAMAMQLELVLLIRATIC